MALGYFGWLAGIVWVFLIPLMLFALTLFAAMLAGGFDGLATWTGSRIVRRVAVGFDVVGRGLTLLLAAAVVLMGVCGIVNGLR